ncbi:MAG: hypothetical protein AAF599_10290, partial [Bacteroidota bacterium]
QTSPKERKLTNLPVMLLVACPQCPSSLLMQELSSIKAYHKANLILIRTAQSTRTKGTQKALHANPQDSFPEGREHYSSLLCSISIPQ